MIDASKLVNGQKVKFICKENEFKDLVGKEFIGEISIEYEEALNRKLPITTIVFWSSEEAIHSVFLREAEILELVND